MLNGIGESLQKQQRSRSVSQSAQIRQILPRFNASECQVDRSRASLLQLEKCEMWPIAHDFVPVGVKGSSQRRRRASGDGLRDCAAK